MHRPSGLTASLKVLLTFVILVAFGQIAHAQLEVKNRFVAGHVSPSTGHLTVLDVDPISGKARYFLTFQEKSFLTVGVNGRWYTNNDVNGFNYVGGSLGAPGSSVTPVPLDNGTSTIVGDTIRTTFVEGGGTFDIVQDVYPVEFRASGQIVLKVKIVNHTNTSLSVEGLQWMNDLLAVSKNNGNDNPYVLERNYYDGQNWRVPPGDGSSSNPPSFYIETERDPRTIQLGTIGCGFTNDSFPPSPMGLTPASGFAAVSWQGGVPGAQGLDYIFGCPPVPSGSKLTSDMACVLQWNPKGVPGAKPGQDTTIEEFRTSFGTQEFCMCVGNALSINIFPTHLQYDQVTRLYTPNPFSVLSIVFNTQQAQISNVNMTHSTAGPVHVVGTQQGGIILTGGQAASYKGASIPGGQVHNYLWSDSTYPNVNCSGQGGYYDMSFTLTASGLGTPWECNQQGNHGTSSGCDVLVDCADVDTVAPIADSPTHAFPGGAYVDSSFTVHDSGPKDFGLKKVYWTYQPASVAALFPVTVAAFSNCSKQPVKVDIQQKDSTVGGCVEFEFTDCTGNIRRYEVCFPPHPPALLPDTVAPKFYNRGYDTQNVPLHTGTGCTSVTNYRFSKWEVIDTAQLWHSPKFPHGIKSIVPTTQNNAKITIQPFGAAVDSTTFTFDVIDSMKDADACVEATDTAGNKASMCVHYCTVPDTTNPTITTASTRRACTVHVTDSVAWDRGLDSVYIFDYTNVQGNPANVNDLPCDSTKFTFVVQSVNPNLPACFRVRAIDCAGNISETGTICLGQDTDVHNPTITATQTNFTHLHVVILDSTDGYDQGIDSVWFTSVKNMKLTYRGNTESHCPGDPATTFAAIHGTPSGKARPKFQQSVTFDLEICDTSNINLNQACVTINAVDGAHDASTDGHMLSTGAYTWCQPITVDVLPPLLVDSNATCSSVTFKATDNRADDRGLDEFKLSNTVNLVPFDLTSLAGSDRPFKDITLNVITKGKSAYGTLTAIDAFGAKQSDPAVKLAHTATGDFWLYAQDLVMKAGHVFLAAGDYKVRVLIDKSDSIKLSQKKLWKLAFSFHLDGDQNIQFVSAQPGAFAPNWNVTVANPSPRNYTISATGTALPDWTAGSTDDELLTLTFHANTSPNTGATRIVIDPIACGNDSYALVYNDGLDTGVTFTNTTMTMHAPFGNINGGVLTIKGECSPFVSPNGAPPTSISLAPVTPNPAWHGTPSLHVMYTIAEEGPVTLNIFNTLGDRVRSIVSESQKQGEYQMDIPAGDLPEGMYFLRLEAGGETMTRRVVLGGY